jgi:hypothetical protein
MAGFWADHRSTTPDLYLPQRKPALAAPLIEVMHPNPKML